MMGVITNTIYTDSGKILSDNGMLHTTTNYKSISDAIAAEPGGTICYFLPSLLLGRSGYLDHWGLKRKSDESIGGQECYLIEVETKGYGFYDIDIRKSDSAIIRASNIFDAGTVNSQRERAHKENPYWFDDSGGISKVSLSQVTTTFYGNIKFNAAIESLNFTLDGFSNGNR